MSYQARKSGPIEVGHIVESIASGRIYKVTEIIVPLSGGHLRSDRTYGVEDTLTGLPNAFRGDEIRKTGTKVARWADGAHRATMARRAAERGE